MTLRTSHHLLLVAVASGGLLASPAHATLMNIPSCSGANDCQITGTPPNPIQQDPNDGILFAWDEQQNVTLTNDLFVDRVFDEGASFVETVSGGYVIKAGTVVSSHYLQWDPGDGSAATVDATIHLDSQIFAFITADQKLFDSDAILGLPGFDYNDFGLRGLETTDMTDFNGTDVDISWTASTPGDWTRLITAFSPAAQLPEPGTLGLLGFGLVGAGILARRGTRH